MTLDLVIRGAGSSRSPGDHLAALKHEVADCRVVSYRYPEVRGLAERLVTDPVSLLGAIREMGDGYILVYGDEALLGAAQSLTPELIWIALGPDANGVREIWRIRQQHPWLSGRKLALLIEQIPEGATPDTDRLVRLSRAAKAILVPLPAVAEEPVAVAEEPVAVAEEPVAVAEEPVAVAEEPVAEIVEAVVEVVEAVARTVADVVSEVAEAIAGSSAEAVVEWTPESLPEAAASADPEPVLAAAGAGGAAEPAGVAAAPSEIPLILDAEGADTIMEKIADRAAEAIATGNPQTEQALMQRYALVKERRSTALRLTQTEANMQELLKELFTNRFAGGPDAAAAFEVTARKLVETSSEFTLLSRTMATVEAGLVKLSWLKDELEI